MPLRRGIPLNFTGRSLSDAVDGSNVGRGAMRALSNLIPNPTTAGSWVCRPGMVAITDFSGFTNPTRITAEAVIGDIVYGLVSTDRYLGKDEPYAYDLLNGAQLPVAGVTNANSPASPPATGQWTPPIVKQVAARVIVTHPGFPGDGGSDNAASNYTKFGWFDISGFVQTLEVDIVSGSPFLYGGFSTLGIQPGMAVTGSALIPAGASIARVFPLAQSANYFAGTSHGTDIIDGIAGPDFAEMHLGKHVLGPGVVPGTTIIATPTGVSIRLSQPTTSGTVGTFLVYGNIPALPGWQSRGDFTVGTAQILNAITTDVHVGQLLTATAVPAQTYVTGVVGTTIFLNQPATATAPAAPFSCAGSVVEMSAPATGSATGPLAVSGGTPAAPLWGAGDAGLVGNVLPSVPVGVGQMNGRAWYACGDDGVPFSDALLPCLISDATAVQALKPSNGLPCTAIGELQLSSQLGGIVQGLIVFQRDVAMQQITGDPTTASLSLNSLPVATGTNAPLTIVPATKGLFFVSPEGLRLVDFSGRVSDPIGQDGQGIVAPFLAVDNPPASGARPASRMAAAANGRNVRITVPTGENTWAEYWYDLSRGIWSGPHTSTAALIDAWGATFVLAPTIAPTELRRSDDIQLPSSTYYEDGAQLTFEFEPTLLPDSGQMAENKIVQSSLGIALPTDQTVQVNFLNEVRQNLAGVELAGWGVDQALWGSGVFGYTVGGPASGAYMQRGLTWSRPMVFKQGTFNVRGLAHPDLVLGNLYFRYQVLGYFMQALPNAS